MTCAKVREYSHAENPKYIISPLGFGIRTIRHFITFLLLVQLS